MFCPLSKQLELPQKYSAACRIFNLESLLGVEIPMNDSASLVFDIRIKSTKSWPKSFITILAAVYLYKSVGKVFIM